MTGTERAPVTNGFAVNGDVSIWYDSHGGGPSPLLLLTGAASQAIQWEPAFYEPLVPHGHRVLRFDWRDIGLSTWRDFRSQPYTSGDLVDDVIAVLDEADVASAHLVGFSMGGLIAQLVAAHHPSRVRSLALLSAGFAGGPVIEDTPRARAAWGFLTGQRPRTPDETRAWLLAQWRLLIGPALPFDEEQWRHRINLWLARGYNPRCPHFKIPRHEQAMGVDLVARRALLSQVQVPTVVLHGDEDGMFTPGNATAIVETIPTATGIVLPGRGHDLFIDPGGEIVTHVLEHVAGVDRDRA